MDEPREGRIETIWIKRMKRGPMDATQTATLVVGRGIEGNADQGGRRQVTLIEREIWDELVERFGDGLSPAARRANILVSGIGLANSRGRILRLGACRIRIFGETRPCERMDEAMPGLRRALDGNWGGGAFGEVLADGSIAVGDGVRWEDSTPEPPSARREET